MTIQNKATLATFFETGDIPNGQNYQNLIDSQVNIAETSAQSMAGPLSPTELITARVSATNANVVTLLSAGTINAVSLSVSQDIAASAGAVYASAMHLSAELYRSVIIVSAFGTAQATATIMTATINRCQGVTDGSTTGFALQANRTGYVQYAINETAASANLWPPTGGTINALAANAAFGMTANTMYTIIHKSASAYAVK